MKSLILKNFLVLGIVMVSAEASPALPKNDPYPEQPEATAAEVESRLEDPSSRIGVPRESASYFAYSGMKNEAAGPAGGALAFCNTDKWSPACLTGLILYRCGQYTFPLTPYGCALAAPAFVGSLDMQRIDVTVDGETYNLPVIFTKKLERLVRTPLVQADLRALRDALTSAANHKTPFDLWQWALTMGKGNLEVTLESLAVLLQDTSAVFIQINYLKGVTKARRFDAATTAAIADLEEVAYQLNSEILSEGAWKTWLRLYPTKDIEDGSTPLIYHFYPMAYLSLTLQRSGFGNRLSSFIPFLFNTEYLNQTLDPMAWPLHHPKPFAIDSDFKRWKMRDLYGGYRGALFGIRKVKKLPSLEALEKDYAKAPYETMRHLFWSMPNP